MKHLNFLDRDPIQLGKKADPHTSNIVITRLFLWGLLMLVCVCFALETPVSADEVHSEAWQEAFALIDKGDRRRAVSKLEGLLQTDLPEAEKLKIHHVLGYNYEKQRNRPQAVRHYARVISFSYPLADCAIYRLAQLYEDMNNKDRAIKWYTQLVKEYPSSFYLLDAKWALAQLHTEKKAYATAKAYLTDLVDQPRYAREAAFTLARCEEALGNISAAFDVYRELIKEKQSLSVARESLGRLKQLVRTHRSLKLTATDRLNCGMVFHSNRQWKSAVNELALIPKTVDLELRAQALYLTGRSNQGRKWPNTSIKNFDAVIALGGKNSYIPACDLSDCTELSPEGTSKNSGQSS